jgi:hypothetical protein
MKIDPLVATNLLLCIIILVMGIVENTKSKTHLPLYVGIAFGLFGVSHLMTLLGLATSFSVLLIVIRLAAYILVIYSLYLLIAKNKSTI